MPEDDPQPPPPESTVVGSLDLATAGDRFKLAEALRRGWKVTPERKRQYFAALDAVIRMEMAKNAPSAIAVCQAVKCLLLEQGQALEIFHKLEDRTRIDAGKGTAGVQHTHCHTIDYDAVRAQLLRRHRPGAN